MLPLLLTACAPTPDRTPSRDDTTTDAGDLTYYEHVKPIVDAKCAGCHAVGGIGPFPLTTFEQASAMREAMAGAVAAGRMPPWPAGEGCNEYAGDRSLTDEQIAVLTEWGGAEGDPTKEGPPLEGMPTLSRVDETLVTPSYTPVGDDDYRCFVLEWGGGETYVTGFGVDPGAAAVVHHVIAYRIPAESADDARALDDGGGYECFGGVGLADAAWIGGWVPGSSGSDFPEGTGIAMEDGAVVAVQMHYNTQTSGPEPDATGILMKTDDSVDYPAAVVKVFDPRWIAGGMEIAAGDADASHSYTTPALLDRDAFVWSASLHMHKLGTSGRVTIEDADANETCLLDIPAWDFDWQGSYWLEEPARFEAGGSATVECHWDNSDGAEDVNWGENSEDEMCLGIAYVTMAD
ncbi:MAG: monooxygenase [Myxococcota bacterium]